LNGTGSCVFELTFKKSNKGIAMVFRATRSAAKHPVTARELSTVTARKIGMSYRLCSSSLYPQNCFEESEADIHCAPFRWARSHRVGRSAAERTANFLSLLNKREVTSASNLGKAMHKEVAQ
jgi:hypothetical protein